jgi:hypothetical protein
MDGGRRQRVERASMLFTECGRETGGILHSDPVAICLEHLAQGRAICRFGRPYLIRIGQRRNTSGGRCANADGLADATTVTLS